MTGQKPFEQLKEDLKNKDGGEEEKKDDITLNKVSLPAELFKDFPDVIKDNEEEFKFLASQIIIQYLENTSQIGANKALEFPECVPPSGRAVIHSLADYLGIAAVSLGK